MERYNTGERVQVEDFEFNENMGPEPNKNYKDHVGYLALRSRPMCTKKRPAHNGALAKANYVSSENRDGFDDSMIERIPTKQAKPVYPARELGRY
mgnify:CR=1 FL=1